ncbi:hypothetical protein ISN45_Un192g000040 [Arabidopsis thaliana x Arabidopsis arenosa]|uniref:Uncharacterized protein n=1 Tax=Arabidopsis thaliana x Arabidopsis arenosa TaxID=1240361 RepID=A0A8T1XGR3_9BRAS|nr:hypothetical protein ISN45_Un192g000040 [Arabidopsis thaliana x Arabidopsis arenosa]
MASLSKSFYTDEQYEKWSIKNSTLTMSLLTILMLIFMANPGTYMEDDTPLLDVAGISGLVYAVLSAIDAFVRPNRSELRIFDELSLVAAYVCLWALMGMIFDKTAFWVFIAVTCAMVVVGGVFAICNLDDPNFGKIKDKQTRDFIAELSTSKNPAAANALTTMALFALFTKPDDPVTKALVEAATFCC